MGGGKGEGGRPSLNRSSSSSSQHWETYDETSHDRNELSMSKRLTNTCWDRGSEQV